MRLGLVVAITTCASTCVWSGHASGQSDSGAIAWAASGAVPLDTLGRGFRSLDPMIASARLIGIGESVHGVQQFMAFRFELLEYLVERHRVTALIVESGLPEAIAVDDYVRGRTDTVDYASALGGEFSESDVVRRLVPWLREWNRGAGRAHPVDVYGADVSIGDGRSMLPALDRLIATVGANPTVVALVDSIRPIAMRTSAPWWGGALQHYNGLRPDDKARLTDLAARLVAEARRVSGGDSESRGWAERFALLVQQDERMLRTGPLSAENPRDASMAANARWLLDRLPLDERAVLWAHNAHVQRVDIEGPAIPAGPRPSLGSRLAGDLGNAYLAIGTAYGGPSIDSATAPAVGSVDAMLAIALRAAPSMLLLRDAPRTGTLGAWLERERPMRFQVGYLTVPLATAFDAIVYFDRATRAVRVR